MYDLTLKDSHFPAQPDAEIRDLTVGGLLREIASDHADAVAMVDVNDDGTCGRTWTYGELLAGAERLALALEKLLAAGDIIEAVPGASGVGHVRKLPRERALEYRTAA